MYCGLNFFNWLIFTSHVHFRFVCFLDTAGIDRRTFAVALVFTASCSMVITTLLCITVINVLSRRSRNYNVNNYKTADNVSDSFPPPAISDDQEYLQIAGGEASPSESPRSSSTFVTSSSKAPSDSNVTQTSGSESGSTKENREGSSGVCSMNSSTSSLASTANYRNTYPFSSSSKTFLYPGGNTFSHDASDDSTSCGSRDHGLSRRTLLKYHDQPPSRRKHSKHRSSRSRERDQAQRLYTTPSTQNAEDETEGESNTTTI